MIRFSCRCGQTLEEPTDRAGLQVQCSHCGLLVDIPSFSEMNAIASDGTYKLDRTPEATPETDLAKLTLVYYPGHRLADGREIDLRGPSERGAMPLKEDPERRSGERPRYDPETGELIVPLDMEQPVKPVPMAGLPMAGRVLAYGREEAVTAVQSLPAILVALFAPLNLVVMGILFLSHFIIGFTTMGSYILRFMVVAPFLLLVFVIGHYAVVVEEMGPGDRDELPRPLRNVNLWEDLFRPFFCTCLSLLLCYGPMVVVALMNGTAMAKGKPMPFPNPTSLYQVLFAVGSVLFPAVFMIVCIPGFGRNLRPDRVGRTIAQIGPAYLLLVALWILGFLGTLWGQYAVIGRMFTVYGYQGNTLTKAYVAFPLLMGGIYCAHAFCWYLGLQYRRCVKDLPWVDQRHIRASEASPPTHGFPVLHPNLAAADAAGQKRAAVRVPPKIR